jgi:uncharacterized membrane protein YfhO
VPPGYVRITHEEPRRVVLQAELAQAGYVVLSDAFVPGWRAEVDGRDVPILPANLMFRAVPVPAGAHQITFLYHPASWVAGAALTLLTSAITAGLLLWGLKE